MDLGPIHHCDFCDGCDLETILKEKAVRQRLVNGDVEARALGLNRVGEHGLAPSNEALLAR